MIGAETHRIPYCNRLSRSWKLLARPMLLFIILPLFSIFTHAPLSQLWGTPNQQQVIQAVSLSILTSIITTGVSIMLGTPVAYLLSQRRSRSSIWTSLERSRSF